MSYENHTIPDCLVERGKRPTVVIDGHDGEIHLTITSDGDLEVFMFQQDALTEKISPAEARKMVDWLVQHYTATGGEKGKGEG